MNRYSISLRPPAGEGALVVAYVGRHETWTSFVDLMWKHGYRPDGTNGDGEVVVLEDGGAS